METLTPNPLREWELPAVVMLPSATLSPALTATADKVDLNVIRLEMANALGESNRHRTAIVDLLSYWHTSVVDVGRSRNSPEAGGSAARVER